MSAASFRLAASSALGMRMGRLSNTRDARKRASSRASGESFLLMGITLSTDAPPNPAKSQRRESRGRQPREVAREEEQSKLGDIAEEQRTEHPNEANVPGVNKPSVFSPPLP